MDQANKIYKILNSFYDSDLYLSKSLEKKSVDFSAEEIVSIPYVKY